MIAKKYLCFLIAIFILLSGCFSLEKAQNEEISYKQELLDDYNFLWQVLKEDYPFIPILEADGVDIKGIYENGIQEIEKIGSVEEFSILLKQNFAQMNNFAHLALVDENLYTYVVEAGEGLNSHQKERYNVFSEVQSKGIYNLVDEEEVFMPKVEMRKYDELKTVYFRFPTFNAAAIERDINYIEDYLNEGELMENIIIDITGNTGGSDEYWQKVIVEPIGGRFQADKYVYLKDSLLNRKFFADYEIKKISSEVPMHSFVTDLGFDSYMFQRLIIENDENFMTKTKRWLLIDEQVFSAADHFANFAQESGWATLVGNHTMGDGDGVESVYISLPNSGLIVRFSTTCIANKDGQLNSQFGTVPDIRSSVGERPLDTCLRLIEKLQ